MPYMECLGNRVIGGLVTLAKTSQLMRLKEQPQRFEKELDANPPKLPSARLTLCQLLGFAMVFIVHPWISIRAERLRIETRFSRCAELSLDTLNTAMPIGAFLLSVPLKPLVEGAGWGETASETFKHVKGGNDTGGHRSSESRRPTPRRERAPDWLDDQSLSPSTHGDSCQRMAHMPSLGRRNLATQTFLDPNPLEGSDPNGEGSLVQPIRF